MRAFQDAVRRRSAGREPVAYITGVRGFRYLELAVDARVLVPRPETELLVEIGLELLPRGRAGGRRRDRQRGDRARAEVGAPGSVGGGDGCERRRAGGGAGERGAAGSRRDRVSRGRPPGGGGARPVDAVLSNPPYVAEGDRATLAPEITRHEPPGALFAGADGLDVIRRLVPAAAAAGARLLAIELGEGQAPAVMELMREAGFGDVEARRDLAGIERVVVGRR